MCLAIPACVEQLIAEDSYIVNFGEARNGVAVGDYVIVHVGYALQTLDQAEAERTLAMFTRLGVLNDLPDESPL